MASSPDRPGQPNLLPQSSVQKTKIDFKNMKKGDFLITNIVSQGVQDARERGVYIVGITNSYFRYYKTPQGGLRPDRMELSFEEVSDDIGDNLYNDIVNRRFKSWLIDLRRRSHIKIIK